MPTPTSRQSHIDQALTNLAIGYSNATYIADQVFPPVPVNKISNKYFIFDKAAWFRDTAAPRAPGTEANEEDYTISTNSYLTIEYALGHVVTDEEIDNADAPLRPFETATRYLADKILLRREKDVLDLVFSTSWASSATPSVLWSNDAADPFGDIETAMDGVAKLIGRRPNVGVIGGGLWRYLKNHPDVIDRVKGGATVGNPAMGLLDGVAQIAGLERLLLASSILDTASEGKTASLGYVAGNHMLLAYVTGNPAISEPSAGYVFTLKTPSVDRFRLETRYSTKLVARSSWDAVLTATDAGYLIKSAA